MNFPSGGTPSRKFRASTLYFWSGGVSKFRAVNDPSGRRVANRPTDGRFNFGLPAHRTVSRRLPRRVVYGPVCGVYGPVSGSGSRPGKVLHNLEARAFGNVGQEIACGAVNSARSSLAAAAFA